METLPRWEMPEMSLSCACVTALCLALFLLLGCQGKEDPVPSTDALDPAPLPAPESGFALEPATPKDRRWKILLHADRIQKMGDRGMRQNFDFTMTLKITAPSRVEFFDVNGPQTIYKLNGDQETKEEEMMNSEGSIVGEADANLVMKDAKDKGRLSNDILMAFPAGPIFGFVPPGKDVKVGDRWSSGDLVPAGPKTLRKKKLVFSNVKGEFELLKVEHGKATIVWTGKADVESRGKKADSAEWKSDILFDLKTNSTEKIELTIKALFPGGIEIRTDLRLEISIP
jgi:hypothetical protein